MAIETISGHQRQHLKVSEPETWSSFPRPSDMPENVTWQGQMARIPVAEQPPLSVRRVATVLSMSRAQRAARNRRKLLQCWQQKYMPTPREYFASHKLIRWDEWEVASRFEGFYAVDGQGVQRLMRAIPTPKVRDNSLWHALSYQVNGPSTETGSHRHGLRGGRREKAWLYHWFTHVLHSPEHVRHRLYTWLQQTQKTYADAALARDSDGVAESMVEYGEYSMLRALASNDSWAGPAKRACARGKGIFQVIADFWRSEVIVFVGNRRGCAENRDWNQPYRVRAFGKRRHGTSAGFPHPVSKTGQLMFVTDNSWAEFDVVLPDGVPAVFDTSHLSQSDRYESFRAHFITDEGRAGSADSERPFRAPMDLVPWTNEFPRGHPSRRRYRRPADDPVFRLADDHQLVKCFEADRDAIETRPGFGDGKMPKLANMITMGAWEVENKPEWDLDTRPTKFEPWLMTSGCYRTLAEPQVIRQGKYPNKVALEAAYNMDMLRNRGLLLEREPIRNDGALPI